MADLLAAVATTPHTVNNQESSALIGLTDEQLANVTEQAIAYAAAHGLLVSLRDPNKPLEATTTSVYTPIPFCLLPVQVGSVTLQ